MTKTAEPEAATPDAGRRIATLSERQLECLSQAGEGRSSKEIARELGIAPSTVDNHIQAAMGKLEVTNRRQAVHLIERLRGRNGPKVAAEIEAKPSRRGVIPPLGGAENRASSQTRLAQILIIAVLSISVVLATLMSIAGVVHILDR